MSVREEMKIHVEKWQASGISQQAYANKIGVSEDKFRYWIKKLEKAKKMRTGGEFITIGKEEKIEISTKQGVVIKVSSQISDVQLRRILDIASC